MLLSIVYVKFFLLTCAGWLLRNADFCCSLAALLHYIIVGQAGAAIIALLNKVCVKTGILWLILPTRAHIRVSSLINKLHTYSAVHENLKKVSMKCNVKNNLSD